MLVTNVTILALYATVSLQEHYECTTEIGVDATSRVEMGFAIGLCSIAFEMTNAHIVLVYARFKLVKDRKEWGLFAHSDLAVYRASFSFDLVFKLMNVLIAAALCYYFRMHVPDNCKAGLGQLLHENVIAQIILCILVLKVILSLVWMPKLDQEIMEYEGVDVKFNKSDGIAKTKLSPGRKKRECMSNLSPIRPMKKSRTANPTRERSRLINSTISGMFSSRSSGSHSPSSGIDEEDPKPRTSLIVLDKPFLEDTEDSN